MTGRRELVFLTFVIIVLLGGVAFDFVSPNVEGQTPIPVAGERYEARAVFCPPASRGGKAVSTFTAVSKSREQTVVGTESGEDEPRELPADEIVVYRSDEKEPLDIVGYGSPVVASAVASRKGGTGAAHCATEASRSWYFAAGSASIDVDERILVYNPFPHEAVVTLGVFTPRGDRSMTSLRDLAVPAMEWRSIVLSDVVKVKDTLAVEVVARRGRVVAWREMTAFGKGVTKGIDYDLGAPSPEMRWFFPDGSAGKGAEETISLLNPGQQEAVVGVILATPDETLTPPDLMEYAIPPRSQRVISIGDFTGSKNEVVSVSAIVTSVNDQPVIAERSVTLDTEKLTGRASELGATETSPSWFLGPADRAPNVDAVVVMAPGSEDAIVDLTILREGDVPLAPDELQGLLVAAGSRIKIPIGEWTGGETVAVLVDADADVVAERFSYGSEARDISALMGQPIKMLP